MTSIDHTGEPPNQDRFAEMVRDAIRAAGESAEILYDPEEFSLTVEGETRNRASLGNVYREYRQSTPEQRARLFRNFIRSWFAPLKGMPEEFEDAAHDLLPAVRTRAYIELNSLRFRVQGAKEFDWPYTPIGEHFALYLVYNLPESLMGVQQRHLDDWGVDFATALDRAVDNLIDMSNHVFDEVAPGVWRSPWADNLDASRLVLIGLFKAHEIRGDPVVMIPNRDTLLLTGADDEEGLTTLVREAEQAYEHARSVSGVAVRLQDDEWVPFLPDEDHPAYQQFRLLQLRSLGTDYAEQKELLDKLHEQNEEDIFVATLSGRKNEETGAVTSYCVWSRGVDSLLPRADTVVFVQMKGDEVDAVHVADWDRVVEVVGELMEETDLYPPRDRVRAFPTAEQLAQVVA